MMAYVGWVEPAIPIVWHAAHLLGIATLHPIYASPDCIRATGARVLSVGCAVRTMVIAIGAHGAPYEGIA